MGEFERRAADISVRHPAVVPDYRAAQALTMLGENGKANTEELRQAVVHYRAVFDELPDVQKTTLAVAPAEPVALPR
jgi:hypothetical protein